MQRASNQFFSCSTFSQNQNGAISIGHPLDHLEHPLHFAGAADNLVELIFLFELFAKVNRFADGGVVGKRALNAQLEFIHLERLLQIIERAVPHRLLGRLDGTKPGNDNDDGGRHQLAGLLQDLQPVGPGLIQIKVCDDQLRCMSRQCSSGGLAVSEGENFMSLLAQQVGHRLHHR